MKGKIWELGPFALAVLAALCFLAARARHSSPAPLEPSVPGKPRTGMAPRASSGIGDPTKPQDFLPDSQSPPDPNSLPDSASTATIRIPAKR